MFEECETPLKLSLAEKWRPYIYLAEDGETKGADVSLLKVILAQMGCQVDIVYFPERRMLEALKHGELDVALGISKTAERVQSFHYSSPYRSEKNKFAYRHADADIRNANSLQDIMSHKKIIAINIAGWYGDELEKIKREYNFFLYGDTASRRIAMLELGRVDIVIEDEMVLCHELIAESLQDVVIHPLLLSESDVHFVFNKNAISTQFVQKFTSILNKMRASGMLTKHYKQHFNQHCS